MTLSPTPRERASFGLDPRSPSGRWGLAVLLVCAACAGPKPQETTPEPERDPPIGDTAPADSDDHSAGETAEHSSSDSDSGAAADTDTGADQTFPGFENAASTWSLPEAPIHESYPFANEFGDFPHEWCPDGAESTSGLWRYELLDLTGDGVEDLVYTRSDCADLSVGTDHWVVYVATGGGYDGSALSWTLPEAPVSDSAPYSDDRFEGAVTCADGAAPGMAQWNYGLYDLTGDLRDDLVFFRDDCGDSTAGLDHWNVYENTGTGFSDTPLAWSLPTAPYAAALPFGKGYLSSGYQTCADGTLEESATWVFQLLELTGDGVLDLVYYVDECGDPTTGLDHWRVYENAGTGFSDTPLDWSLPTAREWDEFPFDWRYGVASDPHCLGMGAWDGGSWSYSLQELTGDGAPDMVYLEDGCGDPALGLDYWEVFENTGSAFSETAIVWPLPVPPVDESAPFNQTYRTDDDLTCSDGSREGRAEWNYYLYDMDVDGRVDLLYTVDTCEDVLVGETYWAYFANTGAGFSPTATSWSLPVAPVSNNRSYAYFDGGGDDLTCVDGSSRDSATWHYTQRDLTGDRILDLLVTRDDCTDTSAGVDHWVLHPGRLSD